MERKGKGRGTLILIGGGEDRKGKMEVLRDVAGRVDGGKLVVATVASEVPFDVWRDYERAFRSLGLRKLAHLHIENRMQAFERASMRVLAGADAVFFTGGDQLKITTKLGGSPVCEQIRDLHDGGGLIAGTSAGASVMSETMLVSGIGGESHKIGGALAMGPGLGLIKDVIVDQHFAQRGRMGRLLGAIAQNPRMIGIGIDEDTAVILKDGSFTVLGSGAVYVADGKGVTFTNISEEASERTMSMFDVKLHILGDGDVFDLAAHRPSRPGVKGKQTLDQKELDQLPLPH